MRTPRSVGSTTLLLLLGLAVPTARAALFAPDGATASGADPCTLVVAVRHAEKDTSGGGSDPALSEAGHARAIALADALAQAHVGAILVSPTRRARETAAPLAERAKVEPQAIPLDGGVETHVTSLAKAVRAQTGRTVLVVGHSNTIPALVRALGLDVGGDLPDDAYGDLLVVSLCEGMPPRLVRASFGRAASDAPLPDRPTR